MCWIGIVPSAWTLNVSGISKTTSGVPIDQPCGNSGGAGAAERSPRRRALLDPARASETARWSVRLRSLAKLAIVAGRRARGACGRSVDDLGDGGRPAPRVIVGQERERGDLAWPVARRTAAVQDAATSPRRTSRAG